MDRGIRDYSRDQLIEDYRRGLIWRLLVVVFALANLDMDSVRGKYMVDTAVPRLVALVNWDCGALIPD